MTKTGQPDEYWAGVMPLYAQGKFKFSTGKKPGAKRWKAAIQRIDACPLTPVFNQRAREFDIFGKRIPCKCGYHKSALQTESSAAQSSPKPERPLSEPAAQSSPRPERPLSEPAAQSSPRPERPLSEPAAQSSPRPERPLSEPATQSSVEKSPAEQTPQNIIACSLCCEDVNVQHFTEHLSDFHAEVTCDTCGKRVSGAIELLLHIEEGHPAESDPTPHQPHPPTPHQLHPPTLHQPHPPTPHQLPPPTQLQPPMPLQPATPPLQLPPPTPQRPKQPQSKLAKYIPVPPPPPPAPWPYLRPPEINWVSFLPSQFMRVIKPCDREWIAQCLYEPTGQLRQQLTQNWFNPPNPPKLTAAPPDPGSYFMQRMFLWAPMRMWGIPLKCQQCSAKMHHSGIYTKVREVIDVDTRYYLVGGDYPKCSKCVVPVCPWSSEILSQLDPSHRNKFPAVLTTQLALDRKCVTLLKPRTLGNSSSYLQQALQEAHSEEWARRTIEYLSDCELHKKRSALTQCGEAQYQHPPPFNPLPLAQWFESVHANNIVGHLSEMKGVITSTYGRILKLDSTKKITKKLAGNISDTATWMTNVSNECGQVLNCVLTTAEGAGFDAMCQGIVQRYRDAGEPDPEVIYVDRDCCSERGEPPVLVLFRPWSTKVRLDIFHFMRRFTSGLTTEHHPLYGTFCSKLSSCIFEWNEDDIRRLKDAKRSELKKKHSSQPTEAQVLSSISSKELARHCRRRTRGVEETRTAIQGLLSSMWELTDTTGLRLINPDSMTHVWEVQQKHLPCIQDPPGVELYTKLGSGLQKGDKVLDVLRCARGSSSVESFHRHQCSFIPGWRSNAMHTQMYMLEGGSRWNINRAREAVHLRSASHSRIYDVRLMCNLSSLSKRVLGRSLIPEFIPPGRPTDEQIAVEYLLAQSGRGNLLQSQPHRDLDIAPSDMQDEIDEDDYPDGTMSDLSDILAKKQPQTLIRASQPEVSSPETSGEFGPSTSPQVSQPLTVPSSPDSADDDAASRPSTSQQVSQPLTVPSSPDGADGDAARRPSTSQQDSRCDARGFPGWEKVDSLAEFLVSLNRTITALSIREVHEIVRLYSLLHPMDKSPTKYALKSKKKTLPGPWRASRKRSGSAPGQQAAERLFMTHGQAAQRPDTNRVSECVCLKLCKEYQQARNRPKDCKDKTLPIPQSIVQAYSHIKQLLEDNQTIQGQTNLMLVTINTTTVSAWLHGRQKRADRDTLLQGVQLPQNISVAKEPMPEPRPLPKAPVEHGHLDMEFQEPENREGEAVIRSRRSNTTQPDRRFTNPSYQQWQHPPAPWSAWPPSEQKPLSQTSSAPHTLGTAPTQNQYFSQPQSFMPPPSPFGHWMCTPPPPFYPGWYPHPPPYPSQQFPPAAFHPQHMVPFSPATAPSSSQSADSRQRKWRLKKAGLEDDERAARGEPPKKRHTKESYHYECKTCGQPKNKSTGHTQSKGKWYCPASGQTVEEWRQTLE